MSAAHHIRKCRNPVHVYIDDSNIYIGGQKLYDSWDYDISKLRNLITRKIGRLNRAALLNFYGAHLDPNLQLDDLYEKDEIHSIFYCPRNGKGEEKQADTQLTADMTRCVSRFHSIKAPCVFVVVSGDGDMVPAVRSSGQRAPCACLGLATFSFPMVRGPPKAGGLWRTGHDSPT